MLLISTIISLLALYFSQTARVQIEGALRMQEYTEAMTQLASAESDIIFALLTSDRTQESSDRLQGRWNFYNRPFQYSERVTIRIEDLSGRINIAFGPSDQLANLLTALGLEQGRIQLVLQSLADWVDADTLTRLNGAEADYYQETGGLLPRNGALQSVEELVHVRGVGQPLMDSIREFLTVQPSPNFNLMGAPDELLRLLLDQSVAEQVIQNRLNPQFDANRFTDLTGLQESEGQYFYPGNVLSVTTRYQSDSAQLSQTFVVLLSAKGAEPISILSRRWNQEQK
ncbi:hypothetical protein GCM10027098_39730 [Bowmanella dokdonensis]